MGNSHIQEDFLTLSNTFLSIVSTSTKNNSSHAGTSPDTKTHQGSKCKLEQQVHAGTNALRLHNRCGWRGSQQLKVLEQPLCLLRYPSWDNIRQLFNLFTRCFQSSPSYLTILSMEGSNITFPTCLEQKSLFLLHFCCILFLLVRCLFTTFKVLDYFVCLVFKHPELFHKNILHELERKTMY